MLPRPCLDCGEPAEGPRCDVHRRQRHRRRVSETSAARAVVAGQPWCSWCGSTEDLTAEHVVPFRDGGTLADGADVLCRSCNSRRQ